MIRLVIFVLQIKYFRILYRDCYCFSQIYTKDNVRCWMSVINMALLKGNVGMCVNTGNLLL